MTVLSVSEEKLFMKRDVRENLIKRLEVLEKVKDLLLLPALELATTQQVADYFEVSDDAVQNIVKRHKDELLSDGYCSYTGSEVKSLVTEKNSVTKIINKRGYFIVETDNGYVKMANRSNGLFSKRAILRVGMLLRDSEVAKEVRTQLLNIEENATNEIRTKEADTELSIIELEVGKAFATGDIKEFAEASIKLVAYKNRHIEKVESKLKEAETTVDILTHEFKTLDKKQLLKKLVNTLAFTLDKPQGKVWTYVYAELMYKTGAVVKKRAKVGGSYLNALTEEELDVCISSASILAKKHNITLSNEVDLI